MTGTESFLHSSSSSGRLLTTKRKHNRGQRERALQAASRLPCADAPNQGPWSVTSHYNLNLIAPLALQFLLFTSSQLCIISISRCRIDCVHYISPSTSSTISVCFPPHITMAGSCSPAADDSFGPVVACPATFDFTLLFEQSILSIGPSAIFLLLVPWRIWSLYPENVKTLANNAHWRKLVSCPPIETAEFCQKLYLTK